MKPSLFFAALAKLQCVSWIVQLPDYHTSQPLFDTHSKGSEQEPQAGSPTKTCALCPAKEKQLHGDTFQSTGSCPAPARYPSLWWHIALDLLLLLLVPKLKSRWWNPQRVIEESVHVDASSHQIVSDVVAVDSAYEQLQKELQEVVLDSQALDCKDMLTLQEMLDKLISVASRAESHGFDRVELMDVHRCRRRVHNALLDLRGCVRVFCRIRPLIPQELANGDLPILKSPDRMTVEIDDGPIFRYDAVFNSGTQEDVFEECKELVQSVVDGYSVAFFSYGQTGAGKTFTMYGDPGNEGIGPRTIKLLYQLMDSSGTQTGYRVTAQMFEIYRNTVLDLCTTRQSVASPSSCAHKVGLLPEAIPIANIEELLSLLIRAQSLRTTCATAINSQSSRSHLVLIVEVANTDPEVGEKLSGKLFFGDLAGSERLKKSKVVGEHQKEAIEVNKSLTALFHVLETLGKPATPNVVPYRNSKLTQIMKECLGGRSKTLMFVNCSPSSSHRSETMMSLARATRAKKIKITPKKSSILVEGVEIKE